MASSRGVSADEVLAMNLDDEKLRAEWDRLAPARAVANLLVAYRAEHGLSQNALGRLVGLRQPAVARMEAADHNPSLDTLQRLSNRLGLTISVTFGTPRNGGKPGAAREFSQASSSGELRVLVSAGTPQSGS